MAKWPLLIFLTWVRIRSDFASNEALAESGEGSPEDPSPPD